MKKLLLAAAVGLLTWVQAPVLAQAQSAGDGGPVHLIVPFAPGGASDVLARLLAHNIPDVSWVVENRPGAGGNVGMMAVAKAAPDGQTISIMSSAATSNPAFFPNVPLDPVKDFTPITEVASVPTVLVVHPSLNVKTVQELIDLVKASPGKYSYASSGVGTAQHLAGALFAHNAQLDLVHVPHNGAGPATTAVLGNHIPIAFLGLPSVRGLIGNGELRALAVTTLKRSALLPDVPTINESGMAGFEVNFWQGIVLPAGASAELVKEYNTKIRKALENPELVKQMDKQGMEPVGSPADAFASKIAAETQKWRAFINEAGISAK